MKNKICPVCKNEFIQRVHNQLYCSKQCYQNARRIQRKDYDMHYAKQNQFELEQYGKQYYQENKIEISEYNKHHPRDRSNYAKNYRILNNSKLKQYYNQYQKERRYSDKNFKILCSLRSRLNCSLKHNSKSACTMELVGCAMEDYKHYLESQFQSGWTWENYGEEWEIDHIRPCCSFDLSDPEQQKACFHYTNTRPLSPQENRSKNGRY